MLSTAGWLIIIIMLTNIVTFIMYRLYTCRPSLHVYAEYLHHSISCSKTWSVSSYQQAPPTAILVHTEAGNYSGYGTSSHHSSARLSPRLPTHPI